MYKYIPHLFICILFLSSAVGVFAVDADDVIDDKQDELEELAEKEEKYKKLIDLKKQEQSSISKQIQKIESQQATVQKDIQTNKQEITTIASDIGRLTNQIEQKLDSINNFRALLTELLRARYDEMLLEQNTLITHTLRENVSFLSSDGNDQISERINRLIGDIEQQKKALSKDQENLKDKKISVEQNAYELAKRNEYLESTQRYKEVLITEVRAESQKYREKLSDVQKRQLEIQNEINSIEVSYIGSFSTKELPSKDKADFDRPVPKPYVVTQGYGKTSFSHHYKGGLHNGVDYAARGDRSILSVGDGKVLAVGDMGRYGYGKWIAIDHQNGLVSMYGHLSKVKAKKGAKVDKGDTIGTMGTTGFSTGVHLHFTLFASSTFKIVKSKSVSGVYIPTGATVNPALYF